MRRALAITAVALIGIAAWAVHVPAGLARWEGGAGDARHYLDCARSIRAGQGIRTRAMWAVTRRIWEPLPTFPPGYPALVAAAGTLGADAPRAGTAVSLACAAGVLVLVSWLAVRTVGTAGGVGVVLATALMPSFLATGGRCYSESAYTLFATGSLACLVAWFGRRRTGMLFLAGLLAGVSYTMRYAATSLVAATCLFLAMLLLWFRLGRWLRLVGAYAAGAALAAGPLLAHSLAAYGKLVPYSMARGHRPLWENVTTAGRVWGLDVTTWYGGAHLAGGAAAAIVLMGLALSAGVWVACRLVRRRGRLRLWRHRRAILLGLYLLMSVAMVLAAHTRFRMGAPINSRHFHPVYWIAWLAVAGACQWFARRMRLSPRAAAGATMVVLLGMAALQYRALRHALAQPPMGVKQIFGTKLVHYLAGEVGKDQIVVADRADLLCVYANVNAQTFPTGRGDAPPVTLADLTKAGDEGLLWGLVIPSQADEDGSKALRGIIAASGGLPGFDRVPIASPAMVFRYCGRRRPPDSAPGGAGSPR